MSDLGEREPQPAGLTHERQQPQHVRVVVSVAGRRAPWRLEDPACFVQPERLAAEAAACRDLPDEQSVARHEREHSPYPKGQGQGGTIRGRAAVYFQLDTWEGAWTRAQLVASQPPLSSSAMSFLFRATLPTLSPGLHILYAYATNRQEASSIQTGGQSSPLIGNIAAHLVIALDCSSPHQIGAGTHIGNVIGPGQGPSLSVCRGH